MRVATILLVLATTLPAEEDAGNLAAEAKLPIADAIDKGLAEAGSGVCFHAELERDKGVACWSIDVAQTKRTCNVVLDARDGTVVEKETEAEDHTTTVGLSKVSLKSAIEAAGKLVGGTVLEARILTVDDRWAAIHVKVLARGGLVFVDVNAETGEAKVRSRRPSRAVAPPGPPAIAFTDTFRVGEWTSTGRNPFFVLEPGYVLVLEGGDVRLTITVLDETKVVDGVETRVVEEREEKGGKLVEVSRNYFAIAKRTNDVFYFGEDIDIYEDGKVASHEGAWLAGKEGARFGLMMPGTPLLGARYCQEIAPGVAMDRAEVKSLRETVETPAGKLEGCLRTDESSLLENGKESKDYAPGIGLVRDGKLRLARLP
jgi:uncharacterized membrane protein YkoI